MVTRGVDGLAKLGGMGPQIASLVRHSEDVIKVSTSAILNRWEGAHTSTKFWVPRQRAGEESSRESAGELHGLLGPFRG